MNFWLSASLLQVFARLNNVRRAVNHATVYVILAQLIRYSKRLSARFITRQQSTRYRVRWMSRSLSAKSCGRHRLNKHFLWKLVESFRNQNFHKIYFLINNIYSNANNYLSCVSISYPREWGISVMIFIYSVVPPDGIIYLTLCCSSLNKIHECVVSRLCLIFFFLLIMRCISNNRQQLSKCPTLLPVTSQT